MADSVQVQDPIEAQASLEATLKDEIIRMYQEVAEQPDGEFHFHHGRDAAELFDYEREWLDRAPAGGGGAGPGRGGNAGGLGVGLLLALLVRPFVNIGARRRAGAARRRIRADVAEVADDEVIEPLAAVLADRSYLATLHAQVAGTPDR